MEAIAKVFYNGNSQAIRIPKELRIDSDEVKIIKEGERLIIEPLNPRKGWNEAFKEMRKNGDDELLIDDMLDGDFNV
ncbi:antitoxin [Caminibacter pacificus]|jgi:virulence-associated protein VagC|uniref:AbrB/MazE/SpoVT family DNA-binding domain-containing protein n=1 Tax=Caminibacter pacificus TaxID=1424653 RepID=A0AAJ4RB91_9BACT|nr:AbrB/MazE/SpoVT family DNA-binding domain-containing protein [Caminibacter pacificus]NPA87388.1 AbrB/MazE/SpoVT family DNA-binding domain-containing protein [Campylobacterota bacterium]QCI29171.1 AbrB/MazE/SpoVT family DNA-binding domain-containing protein [Caminibacter pacificus]ROR38815.1 antitoxin MazE/antitoxin VapB [Caminibacter pacificus]